MEQKLVISERDVIGAELYYCYNYIDNVKRINNSIKNLEKKIENVEQTLEDYSSADDIFRQDINWIQYKEFQEKCKSYYQAHLPHAELSMKKSKLKYNVIKFFGHFFTAMFIIAIVGFLGGLIIVSCLGGKDIAKYFALLASISFILGLGALSILGAFFLDNEGKKTKKSIAEESKSYFKTCEERSINGFDERDVRELKDWPRFRRIYLPFISGSEAVDIFRKHNPDFFTNLVKEKRFYLNKIDEHNLTLNLIENEFKENMHTKNTNIPVVYHNEEDITNLIDYYVRRRGDTWKELVNEYEHDKKLNQIISSIDKLTNQVSVLMDSVIKCFNIVGMQLGIINQSILSLQKATEINFDKISQIENQQEKRLCELTSSVQSINLKTETIIESIQ